MKRILFVCAVVVASFGCVRPAAAGPINLAYINSLGGNVNYLNSYGINVTYINNPSGLTLSALAGYDAIMIASNGQFSDPVGVGNVAQQFANSGRGVVLTEFAFQGVWQVQGGIMTHGYSPFTVDPASSGYFLNSSLGTIQQPSSPLLSGINTANVFTNYQANVGMDLGATLVADWASGRHAIGYNSLTSSSVVGLNLFPDGGVSNNTDTQHLVANAIAFSLSGHPADAAAPEPASLTLLGLGALGIAGYSWRRRKLKAVAV